uniref:Uncharacterized protein n=1 Tax=Tanacetum cinerariifolium TaxID=118510 RepID=A0A699V033_TANCI|nr:hypothetical protein [Tanacetum cinerariifolium]
MMFRICNFQAIYKCKNVQNIYINVKFPPSTQKSHSGGSEDEGPEALGCLHSCSGARFSGAALFGLNCKRKRRIIKFPKKG